MTNDVQTIEPPRTRADEQWPTWHVSVLPDETGLPYDANGCIYWKGRYHLMYIFQDPNLPHGGHCWGHASSADLVDWTFHPAALVPRKGDPDVGIFSGNAFVSKEGRPMLCWFGCESGVCVATAEDDELIRWKKHPRNPIIPCPKAGEPGHGVYTVWDPYLWLEDDTYYCLLGGNRLANGKDTLYLCKSADLVKWEMLHPFYEHPDLTWTVEGEDCSCPDFFKLGDRHALMCISHKVGGRLYVGRFDRKAEKFYPEQHIRMNWPGGTYFAPDSLLDAKGRRIFWAWVTDPRLLATRQATGSGVQSLPRVLALDRQGRVVITPAKELQALRRNARTHGEIALKAGTEVVLDDIAGDSLELAIEIEPLASTQVGLKIRCSPDGREETGIWYDAVAKTLRIDISKSSLRTDLAYCHGPLDAYGIKTPADHKNPKPTVDAPLELQAGEILRLRVFLDKSMLEVFANDRQCVTQQIFPALKGSLLVKICAKGGTAKLRSAMAWDMAPTRFIDQRSNA
jgi:beta-fructofuranosidase